mmetsp:Transcript_56575/g.116758  ORF Transcript_56575/g.116758 Transcript_56575/m.116758 type:complete len:80 (+) Transcript_56575:131-370(+)
MLSQVRVTDSHIQHQWPLSEGAFGRAPSRMICLLPNLNVSSRWRTNTSRALTNDFTGPKRFGLWSTKLALASDISGQIS